MSRLPLRSTPREPRRSLHAGFELSILGPLRYVRVITLPREGRPSKPALHARAVRTVAAAVLPVAAGETHVATTTRLRRRRRWSGRRPTGAARLAKDRNRAGRSERCERDELRARIDSTHRERMESAISSASDWRPPARPSAPTAGASGRRRRDPASASVRAQRVDGIDTCGAHCRAERRDERDDDERDGAAGK